MVGWQQKKSEMHQEKNAGQDHPSPQQATKPANAPVYQQDLRAVAQRQASLQVQINQSKRVQRQAKWQQAIGTVQAARVQGNQAPVQRAILAGNPNVQQDNGRAGSVEVRNIRGETYGDGANQPSVSPYGWQQLNVAGHTLGHQNTTHYNAVRMHLWNGRLDGPGDAKWNLAPGPAEINSSMSAGPEMASKLAVDAGFQIWLRTEVDYETDVVTNANDYTSVVPNMMKMEWGYMLKNNQKVRKNVGTGGTVKGPAQAPAWQKDIDPPLAALSPQQVQDYQNWDTQRTQQLKNHLDGKSNQAKAQAFGVVPNQLKTFLLQTYPIIYQQYLSSAERGRALNLYNAQSIINYLSQVQNIQVNSRNFWYYGLAPLIASGHSQKLQAVFALLHHAIKREHLLIGKLELISQLGNTIDALLVSDALLFSYLRVQHKLDLFLNLNLQGKERLLKAHPSSTQRRDLLRRLAIKAGASQHKPQEQLDRVLHFSIPVDYFEEFEKSMKHFLNQDEAKRPSTRSRPKPFVHPNQGKGAIKKKKLHHTKPYDD